MDMVATYWGVRGSMPSPGPSTARYGGNTACVAIEWDNAVLVIDAGTGIRGLGKHLAGTRREIVLVLSHLHFDHVLGFPLFEPLFEKDRTLYLVGHTLDGRVWTPLDLMDGTHWPLTRDDVKAECRTIDIEAIADVMGNGLEVRRIAVNHPGGAYGFRVQTENAAFVHVPDNELFPPHEPVLPFDDIVTFCAQADFLSHDAQYLEREMPMKEGWGHSLTSASCQLAVEAEVRCLGLFHHDPDRTDTALDEIGERTRRTLEPHGIRSVITREGMCVRFTTERMVVEDTRAAAGDNT